MAALKAVDVAIALYLCRHERRPSYAEIARALAISGSEAHAGVKRAHSARLLLGPESDFAPNRHAVEEFVFHGVKYAFPASRGEVTRGVPTAYAAEPLRSRVAPGDDPPPVWPCADGNVRGVGFEPLYEGAPKAALKDPILYEMLALVDALRDGRARERKMAEELIVTRIRP